jgi:hypothetical protein
MQSGLLGKVFASAFAFSAWSIDVADAAPFDPFGTLAVTGTFGSSGQTLSGTMSFLGGQVSGGALSISGVPGVFNVLLGQNIEVPPPFPPPPPEEFIWDVAFKQSGPPDAPRMGVFFLIESVDLVNIAQILGPIIDGNYINPPVDCITGTCKHSADGLTGNFEAVSLVPLPATLPLFATGLGALGLLGWRRKRRAQAVA